MQIPGLSGARRRCIAVPGSVAMTLAVAAWRLWPTGAAAGDLAVAIATGGDHTCAVTAAGGLKCWGSNEYGQLGDGTTTERDTPVKVKRLTGGVAAAATGGYHTCAVTAAGGVKCWGWNGGGQLGGATSTDRRTLAEVT